MCKRTLDNIDMAAAQERPRYRDRFNSYSLPLTLESDDMTDDTEEYFYAKPGNAIDIRFSQAEYKTIVIHAPSGQEYWLNMVDGKLETGGDLPMTEAAEIFFKEVKRVAEQCTNKSVGSDPTDIEA